MRIGESVVDRLQGVEHVAPGRNGEIVEAGDLLPVNVDCCLLYTSDAADD